MRGMGMMRAELRDLLNELGTSGLLTLAASVCREEEAEARSMLATAPLHRRAVREVDVSIWQGRVAQFEMLSAALVASFEPKKGAA